MNMNMENEKKNSFTWHNNKDLYCKNFTKASLSQLEVEKYDEVNFKHAIIRWC